MSVDLGDLFLLQLAQQASLYNITHNYGRRQSAERVERFFYHLLEMLPVSETLEAGAHEATFSRTARKKLGDKIRARAFEANPLVFSHFLMDEEMRASGVEYVHSAIGDRDGSWPFRIYASTQGKTEPLDSRRHSCLLRVDSPEDRHHEVIVPMARLDTLCSGDPGDSLYALWVDAEGFGLQVLEGAQNVLLKTAAIYMEMESSPHFEGQALDGAIMRHLLARDFVPILRDFLFPHQYNAIFVNKAYLPAIEQEWHRFFQAVLRQELATSFGVSVVPQPNIRKRPPVLETRKAASTRELRSVMDALPLLRSARDKIDPAVTRVVCHYSQLPEAVAWYGERYELLPVFCPLDMPGTDQPPAGQATLRQPRGPGSIPVTVGRFDSLTQAMDIHVFFMQHRRPGETPFARLALGLQAQGIERYSIEAWSMEKFYLRNSHANYTEEEWRTIRDFYNSLADSMSQYTYLAVCKARMLGDPGYIPLAEYAQYEHPLVEAAPGDIVCEGGCSPVYEPGIGISSTTAHFAGIVGERGAVWAFEPVKETWAELKRDFAGEKAVHVEPLALWSESGSLELSGEGSGAFTAASTVGDCPCVSVDDFFAAKALPNLIKLDVEGAELEVLRGAEKSIRRKPPRMLISIYHSRPARDWVRIPGHVLRLGQPYAFYCGHHRPWFNETVLYARPLAAPKAQGQE